MNFASHIVRGFAPARCRRTAIHFGVPVRAQKNSGTGGPRGVSVARAHELTSPLEVPLSLASCDAAGIKAWSPALPVE